MVHNAKIVKTRTVLQFYNFTINKECPKVAADENWKSLSGNFWFLTQMGDRIIQPLNIVIEFYKNQFICNSNVFWMLRAHFRNSKIDHDIKLNPLKSDPTRTRIAPPVLAYRLLWLHHIILDCKLYWMLRIDFEFMLN